MPSVTPTPGLPPCDVAFCQNLLTTYLLPVLHSCLTGGYAVAVGLLLTGEGLRFVEFVAKYPSVLIQLITFSLCSAIGQVTALLCLTALQQLLVVMHCTFHISRTTRSNFFSFSL